MTHFESLKTELSSKPRRWLVSGAAGFIGSHLVESLLGLGQEVVGLDNFCTGHRHNLDDVRALVGDEAWGRFRFMEADIRDAEACRASCQGVDYVLHQAALGSVPRSIEDPVSSFQSNVMGTLNMMVAAKEAGIRRFVYASSSSVYGDSAELPKTEGKVGNLLSPYAASKWVDELIAGVFQRCYGLDTVGLRYFNVFGPRQDPEGPYAAVIPKWIQAMARGEPVFVNGDGETSRDFCFITNVVQANLLAATTRNPDALNGAFNVAASTRTTLNELFVMIRSPLAELGMVRPDLKPTYREFRAGDVRHSLADLTRIAGLLGYEASHSVQAGMVETVQWYIRKQTGASTGGRTFV